MMGIPFWLKKEMGEVAPSLTASQCNPILRWSRRPAGPCCIHCSIGACRSLLGARAPICALPPWETPASPMASLDQHLLDHGHRSEEAMQPKSCSLGTRPWMWPNSCTPSLPSSWAGRVTYSFFYIVILFKNGERDEQKKDKSPHHIFLVHNKTIKF